ncbi:MAG: HlyD family efflux transporter periplasmic adaptor subunit [Bacteroidota bacterium]
MSLFALIIAAQGWLTSCSTISGAPPEAEAETKTVETKTGKSGYVIKKEDLSLIPVTNSQKKVPLSITGRVIPKNSTQLFSEVQGKIKEGKFSFKKGRTFSKGSTLIELDAQEFTYQLQAQKSAFMNILSSAMPDLKNDYPDNFNAWQQYLEEMDTESVLKPLPAVTDEKEKYFLNARQVYSTYFNIKAQEERLSKFAIRAPFSGMITESMIDKGTLVSPGQLLGTLVNNREYELEAAVNVALASQLKVGDKITFTSNLIEGTWQGTVNRKTDIVDTKTQNISVFFTLSGNNLKGGLYLEGKFEGAAYEKVFTIDAGLLSRDGKVYVLDNNTIIGKKVETVEVLPDSVIVKGLSDKDMVIGQQFEVPVEGKKISG